MGMAASQARLLSITSRMADNELRSQLINNAKMRLTEDSSKASDKYISALNKTQYMMSNKDTLGNDLYQQLTFNNLTAYSAYNNQYGLINRSGQLVVSELDAAKFDTAIEEADKNPETDALTEFLKQYGIEKESTSYWENANIPDDMKVRYEGDIEYDDNANRISGLHYGYELSKTSTEVMVYERLLDKYNETDAAFSKAITKNIKEFINDYKPSGQNTTYEDQYTNIVKNFNSGDTATPMADSQAALNYLKGMYNELTRNGYVDKNSSKEFCENMDYYLNDMIKFNGTTATIEEAASIRATEDGFNINGGLFLLTENEGNYSVELGLGAQDSAEEGYTYAITSGVTLNNGEYSFNYTVTTKDENGNSQVSNGVCKFTKDPVAATTTEVGGDYEAAETVIDIYKYFQQNILNNVDRNKFAYLAPEEQKEFNAAAKDLSMFIFGMDIGQENYDKLDDMEWIINDSGVPTTNLDGTTMVTIQQNIEGEYIDMQYLANFEAIKDIYLCEEMIAEFGAPKYTWIDKNNPNENADAKAQWYTNIFEKLQENGYQKIEKSLTESPDWIQYALESGLLSMVQVNDEYTWVSTMYSNCSDITEDTIELEITKAEAEYTRETNKIQAKDKKYDLELKNIDTEHNSLQTEYDSIKSVIDKNVERHFKLFS